MIPNILSMALTVLILASSVSADDALVQEIWERFDDQQMQRDLWVFDPRTPPGTVHSIDTDSWKMTIPGGTVDRAPANLASRFRLKGDFCVETDFQLLKVPTLKSGNLQVAIFVSGRDGHAAVMRAFYKDLGHGYSVWYEPMDKTNTGHWENHVTTSNAGRIRIRRRGTELAFESQGTGEKNAKPIGRLQFGDGPIDTLEIRVIIPATKGVAQVVIDNIHITADQIILPQKPASSMIGRRAWIAAVAGCVLLVVGGGMSLVYQRSQA